MNKELFERLIYIPIKPKLPNRSYPFTKLVRCYIDYGTVNLYVYDNKYYGTRMHKKIGSELINNPRFLDL